MAYVTEIRDTQKGRKVRPSLRLVVGLNRAADCVTARASNECVGGRMRADFAVSASVCIAAGGLTLILACGSQAVRSPALVHSMHNNAERCRLSFHMPHILWASPPMAAYEKRHPKVSFAVVVGLNRLELSTSRLSGVCSNQLSYNPLVPLSGGLWWRCTDSNRGPLECKSSALPTELHPRGECLKMIAPA